MNTVSTFLHWSSWNGSPGPHFEEGDQSSLLSLLDSAASARGLPVVTLKKSQACGDELVALPQHPLGSYPKTNLDVLCSL